MLADVSRVGPLADISRSECHLRFSNRQQSGLQCQRRRRAETQRSIAQAASDSFVPLPSLTGTAARQRPQLAAGKFHSCRFYLISSSTRMRIDIGTAPTAEKTNEIATGQADYSRSEPLHCSKTRPVMSALGHSRPMRSKPHEHVCPLLPRKRTNGPTSWDVRFVPEPDNAVGPATVTKDA
jgi:hypothetical protein